MAWIFEGGSLDTPYHQWKTQLLQDELDHEDYDAKAAVAGVYKSGGRLLLSHEVPKLLKFEKPKPAVRSINQVENGAIVVDEVFKTVVEGLDPGVHQFIPLEVHYTKTPFEGLRYIWNIHVHCDELDWEQSTTKEETGFDRKKRVKLVVQKKNVVLKNEPGENTPHAFRLTGSPQVIAFSDQLKEALDFKKLLKSAPIFQANQG